MEKFFKNFIVTNENNSQKMLLPFWEIYNDKGNKFLKTCVYNKIHISNKCEIQFVFIN